MPTPDQELLGQLLQAFDEPDRLESLLKQHQPRLTPAFATFARAVHHNALAEQRYPLAQRASAVAALVFARNGRTHDAIDAQFDLSQVAFMDANTPEQYALVRTSVQHIADLAAKAEAGSTVFKAWTRAAECAFFAAEAEPDFWKKQEWWRSGVSDLVQAAGVIPDDAREELPNFFGTFVSVLCTLYDRCSGRVWTDAEMNGEWWRIITGHVERMVPIDYQLPSARAGSTHPIRRALAELSEKYGDPNIALERLEQGLDG